MVSGVIEALEQTPLGLSWTGASSEVGSQLALSVIQLVDRIIGGTVERVLESFPARLSFTPVINAATECVDRLINLVVELTFGGTKLVIGSRAVL
jgi:hypothetical protein